MGKKISIIIAFNKGLHYLKDCLESIAMQKDGTEADKLIAGEAVDFMQKIEIETIVVGDDAEAGAEELVRKYENASFVKLPESKGVAAARNFGIQHAQGDYLYIMDSDDFLMPGALFTMMKTALDENSDIVIGKMKKTWYGLATELKEASTEQSSAENREVPGWKLRGADSAVHILYRNTAKNILFNEDLIYNSDLPFTAELFAKADKVSVTDAIYMKRSHNDAIRLPSLGQIKDTKKPYELLDSYREAVKHLEETDHHNRYTDCRIFLGDYLCRYIEKQFLKGKHPEGYSWDMSLCEEYAEELSKLLVELPQFQSECLDLYTGAAGKVLNLFSKCKCRKAVRKARKAVFRRKKRGLLGSKMQWKWAIYKYIFRKLPIKQNLVIFESFLGKSYGDSCKYIYQYMLTLDKPFKYVWFLENKKAVLPGNPKIVKPMSLRYFYYVARYRYWVNNMRQPVWYDKRPGTFFLETWHGTPLKKLVFDMEEVHSASPEYKMHFYKQSRVWDYLISDNPFSTDAFESAFLYPREKILEMGYPRNDLLYNRNNKTEIDKIKDGLNLPKDKKIILYAPTWRDDEYYAPGQYKFTLPLDLRLLQEKLNEDYIILLRTHYFIADNMVIEDDQKSFVRDVSRYHDIGELYLISDICITDYSSVFFDYANLRRPILFYVYDFEKYKDVLRGFYIDMESDLPGPLLYNNTQVLEALLDIEHVQEEYKQKYKEFCDRFCCLDDGHAAERIVKKIWG